MEPDSIILPLAYLPSIDHYCYIAQNEHLLFEIHETYPKQTCRNRTTIYSANGTLRLTVPIVKVNGNSTRTHEVIIDDKSAWNQVHFRAICSAYNNSPFFLYYKDEFAEIYRHPEGRLIDFNLLLIKLVNKFLKINTNINLTTDYIRDYDLFTDKRVCTKDLSHYDHHLTKYNQVFSDRLPFLPNLSILDLLFNEGPYAGNYLKCATLKEQMAE